jgi:hypothetical protein
MGGHNSIIGSDLQGEKGINAPPVSIYPYLKEKPAAVRGGFGLFLPRTLLVAIGLQALSALVLVHLEAAFLLEVSHMEFVQQTCDSPTGLSSAIFP